MTIFVNKETPKKDGSSTTPPEVVTEVKLLVDDKKENDKPVLPPGVAIKTRQRRFCLMKLCAVLMSLALVLVVIFVAVRIYHTLRNHELYVGKCGVRMRKVERDGDLYPVVGEFEQQVVIEDTMHERIEVPSVSDTRRATILHDFSRNVTAIVDKDQSVCFLMPLNRTLVKPPENFLDMLVKLKSGYYIPDVNVINENYHTVTPPVQDLTAYGYTVWNECHEVDTFRLVRDGDPVAMSKRSATWCPYAGNKWCLGDAGGTDMLCFTVTGCL